MYLYKSMYLIYDKLPCVSVILSAVSFAFAAEPPQAAISRYKTIALVLLAYHSRATSLSKRILWLSLLLLL